MPDLASPAPYTWDDFLVLDDDDRRELIDGELVEIEVPNGPHERIVAMLCYFLTAWSRSGHGGHAYASGYKVRIGERRGLMPDVQFYRRDNDAPLAQEAGLTVGRPDLVVEVVSPSSRRHDRVTKLHWYASRGIPEYWLVDPDARTLEQLVLRDGRYVIEASVAADATFEPAAFEGMKLSLSELWS